MVVNNKGVLKMNRFNLESNGLLATGEDWYKYGMDFFNNDDELVIGVYYGDEDKKDNRFNIVVNNDMVNPLKELSNDEEWLEHGYNTNCLWGHKHSIQGELTEDKIKDYIFNKFIPQYGIEFM